MATSVYAYALTTRDRVKALAGITGTDSDAIIDQLINVFTDFVEKYCGGRRFAATDYTEVYDSNPGTDKIFLNQRPVISLTSVAIRGGVPSSPTWTVMNADNYLLYDRAGYVGFFAKFGGMLQAFRVIYRAGFLINWANAGDNSTHTLPADLSGAVETAIVRKLTMRKAQGVQSESTEGQSITFAADANDFTRDERNILSGYKAHRIAS